MPLLALNQTELLAPAKDYECGVAAIDCGADAVYIGAPKFGAREAAGNSLEDITALVHYAHKFWARVYAAVNTILRNDELPGAVRTIDELYDAGVDAVIIQDVGLLESSIPPIPLIASTQMHNDGPERVAFLEQVGFDRVILARELDLPQIRAIHEAAPKIELECFIHGALCVCYSGQCYLSYAMGGRSGNRGQCAQPCRRQYDVFDAAGRSVLIGKHPLSLRDLNLSDHLGDLLDAGVRSFKIEGRLKDKAYVRNAVAHYRGVLDAQISQRGLSRSSSGESNPGFVPDVSKTLNRGFTSYFVTGKRGKIGSIDSPKMVGERIGVVKSISAGGAVLDVPVKLTPGDGICFFDQIGRLRGTVINKANVGTFLPDKPAGIREGTVVFRNRDQQFLSQLEKAIPRRKIGVQFRLTETAEGLALRTNDEDGVQASFEMPIAKTPANKPEQAMENIRKQLSKTGDSDFACSEVEIGLSEPLFIPISDLNALRRGAVDNLAMERERKRPAHRGGVIKNDVPYPVKDLDYRANVLNSKAEAFYRRHGVERIEPAAESGLDMSGRPLMRNRHCVRFELGLCAGSRKGADAEPLYLVDENRGKLELRFKCRRCEMEVRNGG